MLPDRLCLYACMGAVVWIAVWLCGLCGSQCMAVWVVWIPMYGYGLHGSLCMGGVDPYVWLCGLCGSLGPMHGSYGA